MDQTTAATPKAGPAQAPDDSPAIDAGASIAPADVESVGFAARGRVRRRARFLRKARELAYRDLGGLVFNLHRFGQRNDALVLAKLTTLSHIDAELRTLELALAEHRPVTVLREAGITACPRCAAIHSSEDHFCPNCGLSIGRRVEQPATAQSNSAAAPAPAGGPPAQAGPDAAPSGGARPGAASPAPIQAAGPTTRTTPATPSAADSPAEDDQPTAEADQPTEIVRTPPKVGT